jgi:hypothetical protein
VRAEQDDKRYLCRRDHHLKTLEKYKYVPLMFFTAVKENRPRRSCFSDDTKIINNCFTQSLKQRTANQ